MENIYLLDVCKPGEPPIPVSSTTFSIGRGLGNTYMVEDLNTSRRQCVLKFEENEWYIYDKSRNGTWLNENLLDKNVPSKLTSGDTIKLSETCKYTFKVIPDVSIIGWDMNEAETVGTSEDLIAPNAHAHTAYYIEPTQSALCEPSTLDSPTEPSALQKWKVFMDIVEAELECSICSEIFIKAITLNCSHTFCTYCITQWEKYKSECPICRTRIVTKCPTLVIDSYIEKMIESVGGELMRHRRELQVQRDARVNREILHNPSQSVAPHLQRSHHHTAAGQHRPRRSHHQTPVYATPPYTTLHRSPSFSMHFQQSHHHTSSFTTPQRYHHTLPYSTIQQPALSSASRNVCSRYNPPPYTTLHRPLPSTLSAHHNSLRRNLPHTTVIRRSTSHIAQRPQPSTFSPPHTSIHHSPSPTIVLCPSPPTIQIHTSTRRSPTSTIVLCPPGVVNM